MHTCGHRFADVASIHWELVNIVKRMEGKAV
jgi:hypothetical protein